MILKTEEDINKVEWFISKEDYDIYGLYNGSILYSFEFFEYWYSINYIDRNYISEHTLEHNLMAKIKEKKIIEYESVDFFIKMKRREEKLNNLLLK